MRRSSAQVEAQAGRGAGPALASSATAPRRCGAQPPGDADGRRRGQEVEHADRDRPVGEVRPSPAGGQEAQRHEQEQVEAAARGPVGQAVGPSSRDGRPDGPEDAAGRRVVGRPRPPARPADGAARPRRAPAEGLPGRGRRAGTADPGILARSAPAARAGRRRPGRPCAAIVRDVPRAGHRQADRHDEGARRRRSGCPASRAGAGADARAGRSAAVGTSATRYAWWSIATGRATSARTPARPSGRAAPSARRRRARGAAAPGPSRRPSRAPAAEVAGVGVERRDGRGEALGWSATPAASGAGRPRLHPVRAAAVQPDPRPARQRRPWR